MKKFLVILLTLLLVLGSGTTTLAKNSKHFNQLTETLPEFSEYQFSYTLPDYILADKETDVDVTFQTETEGQAGYENVCFEFSADCLETTDGEDDGDVIFSASDGTANYSFTNFGMWGPPGGFDLPAVYDETTEWTLEFSKAGEYIINFKAIDENDYVIAEGSQDIIVKDTIFLYEVPEDIVANEEIEIEVSFITAQSYDDVRFKFSAEGPGDVVFEAQDSNNNWYTFTNTGYWGSLFDINGDYNATTTWFITFSQPGDYDIMFDLIDSTGQVLVSGNQDVTVKNTKTENDEEENEEGENGNIHGLMNALRNHLKIRNNGNSNARVRSTERLMELIQNRGVSMEELEEAIEEMAQDLENEGDGSEEDYTLLSKMYQQKGKKYETFINGKRTEFDVPPMLKEGRTLVPFRKIAEELGAEVSWNSEDGTVVVTKGETTIVLTINSNSAQVNGETQTLDVPAQIYKNRTLVPLRFLAEGLC